MDKWPKTVESWSQDEILTHVKNAEWQSFRLSLKGIPTKQKLLRLFWYLLDDHDEDPRAIKCRVDNYINALKRGGQLNMDLEVQR